MMRICWIWATTPGSGVKSRGGFEAQARAASVMPAESWGANLWVMDPSSVMLRAVPVSRSPCGQPLRCALRGLLEPRSGETGERRERRLRGVQPEPKVRVVVGRVEIGGLVPVRVPPCPDLRAALVFAQADGRHVILERRGVGVRHVRAA